MTQTFAEKYYVVCFFHSHEDLSDSKKGIRKTPQTWRGAKDCDWPPDHDLGTGALGADDFVFFVPKQEKRCFCGIQEMGKLKEVLEVRGSIKVGCGVDEIRAADAEWKK